MLSVYRSRSRSPRANGTTINQRKAWSLVRSRAACSATRRMTRMQFESRSRSRIACLSSRPVGIARRSCPTTRSCTRRARRSNAPSTCSSRLVASPRATRRRCVTTRRSSRSGAPSCGSESFEAASPPSSDHSLVLALASSRLIASLMSMDTTRTICSLPARWSASLTSFSRRQTSSNAADSVADPRAVR